MRIELVPAVSRVHVTLKSTITDKLNRQPVRATVLRDGVGMFREVSYLELVQPVDLPGADHNGAHISVAIFEPEDLDGVDLREAQ